MLYYPVLSQTLTDDVYSTQLVLNTIRTRYQQRIIYTYSGIVLIAANPFDRVALYEPEIIQKYSGKRRGELEPHLFAIAEDAYRCMIRESSNQTIIVSGESGAGKTVSAKFIMRYFATADDKETTGKKAKSGAMTEVEEQILGEFRRSDKEWLILIRVFLPCVQLRTLLWKPLVTQRPHAMTTVLVSENTLRCAVIVISIMDGYLIFSLIDPIRQALQHCRRQDPDLPSGTLAPDFPARDGAQLPHLLPALRRCLRRGTEAVGAQTVAGVPLHEPERHRRDQRYRR